VQNPGRSGHCKWVAVYQKSHWGNPWEGGKLAITHKSGNLPGHILVRMHPPRERAVPGPDSDLKIKATSRKKIIAVAGGLKPITG